MPAAELAEWMAYFGLEPWGEGVMDLRFGLLGSIILNMVRGKNDPAVRPLDLCPDYAGERRRGGVDLRELDPAETRTLARTLAASLGASAEGTGEPGPKATGPTIAG